MEEKISKAIKVLEVNKMISSSQTEFVESSDIAIKALEKQLEMLRYCDEHKCCVGCEYRNCEYEDESVLLDDLTDCPLGYEYCDGDCTYYNE